VLTIGAKLGPVYPLPGVVELGEENAVAGPSVGDAIPECSNKSAAIGGEIRACNFVRLSNEYF